MRPHTTRLAIYTCDCGHDRHGNPYNRRSVMHAHADTPVEPGSPLRGPLRAMLEHIRTRYGTSGPRMEAGWYRQGGRGTG